jgi:hypothetical protein
MKSSNDPKIEAANEAYRLAEEALRSACRKALPIGTNMAVSLGGRFVIGKVERYGPSWTAPSDIVIRNTRTGKLRRVIRCLGN